MKLRKEYLQLIEKQTIPLIMLQNLRTSTHMYYDVLKGSIDLPYALPYTTRVWCDIN